jgi:hypothetical protein
MPCYLSSTTAPRLPTSSCTSMTSFSLHRQMDSGITSFNNYTTSSPSRTLILCASSSMVSSFLGRMSNSSWWHHLNMAVGENRSFFTVFMVSFMKRSGISGTEVDAKQFRWGRFCFGCGCFWKTIFISFPFKNKIMLCCCSYRYPNSNVQNHEGLGRCPIQNGWSFVEARMDGVSLRLVSMTQSNRTELRENK